MTLPDSTTHEQVNINLELSSDQRQTNGHATSVFPKACTTDCGEDALVAKVSCAEESRRSELAMLEREHELVKGNDDAKEHIPEMMCYKVYHATSTRVIRERLGPCTDGSRVHHVNVFQKLKPIAELYGGAFLHAWWETVKCHYALWKADVRHRDISPANLMYQVVDGKIRGVLNDFDLATIGDGVTGTERTGTVPFMAVELLSEEGLKGEVKHLYEHDAESFLWVLTWITLRYDNGISRGRNREMDVWLSADAITCGEKKGSFVYSARWKRYVCGQGHERNFEVVDACMQVLHRHTVLDGTLEIDRAFEKFLKGPVEPFLSPKN